MKFDLFAYLVDDTKRARVVILYLYSYTNSLTMETSFRVFVYFVYFVYEILLWKYVIFTPLAKCRMESTCPSSRNVSTRRESLDD